MRKYQFYTVSLNVQTIKLFCVQTAPMGAWAIGKNILPCAKPLNMLSTIWMVNLSNTPGKKF